MGCTQWKLVVVVEGGEGGSAKCRASIVWRSRSSRGRSSAFQTLELVVT